MKCDNRTITIPDPSWGSDLANIILDLEKLRSKKLYGEVPSHIFFQLKNIFQILETLGSARIEGNNTTLSDYVENIIESEKEKDESQTEISNLDKAIAFIEENINEETNISRAFIFELHKIITDNLTPPPTGEGSHTAGNIRKINVQIKNTAHTPPDFIILADHVEEFIRFINTDFSEQYQLLMVAVAHHRFSYIHPFDNGNGRMGRLLNYVLLIKLGFQVKQGRIINPSSVFYTDRNKYYDMLGKADSLKDEDILEWAEYFLAGLKNEIEKIDSLLKRKYVQKDILLPTLQFALERKHITDQEFKILKYLVNKDKIVIKAEELEVLGIKTSLQKSRLIKHLKDKKIIKPLQKGGRIYTINFINSYLLRGIIETLKQKGFVSDFLNNN